MRRHLASVSCQRAWQYPFKCGFPLAEELKEAENVFLTHGWESGYRCEEVSGHMPS